MNQTLAFLSLVNAATMSPLFAVPQTRFQNRFTLQKSSFSKAIAPILHSQFSTLSIKDTKMCNILSTAVIINSNEEKVYFKQQIFNETVADFGRCIFMNCYSNLDYDGGAISCQWAKLKLEECSFYGNRARNAGGSFSARYCTDVDLISTEFESNSASYAAGIGVMFLAFNVRISMLNSTSDSAALRCVGLMFLSCDRMIIQNSIFFNTSGNGACIYTNAGEITIHRCYFMELSAKNAICGEAIAMGSLTYSQFWEHQLKSVIDWSGDYCFMVNNCKFNQPKDTAFEEKAVRLILAERNEYECDTETIRPRNVRTFAVPTASALPTPLATPSETPTATGTQSAPPTESPVASTTPFIAERTRSQEMRRVTREPEPTHEIQKVEARKMLDMNIQNLVIAAFVVGIGFFVVKRFVRKKDPIETLGDQAFGKLDFAVKRKSFADLGESLF